jgi:hypothetical protein
MLMGKNLADIFLKEMKQTSHFMEVLDLFMCHRLVIQLLTYSWLIVMIFLLIFEGGISSTSAALPLTYVALKKETLVLLGC